MPRYLTKSRFKLASECPTKLYYTGKRDQYADQSDENSFLMILAEGSFQVGELAKLYHPGGVDVPELDHETALARTSELLQQDKVVIFEAAFAYEQLFIRVDVLIKKGRQIELIEVKAKSCRGTDPSQFLTKRTGKPTSDWRAYLEDAAFQKYVTSKAHPEFAVHTHHLPDRRSCARWCYRLVRHAQRSAIKQPSSNVHLLNLLVIMWL